MNTPLVSIIINNYNYRDFLSEAVESALDQSYPNVEVVVVDDGSTDGSPESLAGYKDRLILIAKKNGGQASAFNVGFARSSGEIVIFLDSDDILFRDAVETIVLNWHPDYSKLHFPLNVIGPNGERTEHKMPRAPLRSGSMISEMLATGRYVSPPTTGNAYSRTFISTIFPMPEKGWEEGNDSFINVHAAFAGPVGAVNRPLGGYRVHGVSMSAVVTDSGIRISQLKKLLGHQIRQKELIDSLAIARGLDFRPNDLLSHYSFLKLELSLLKLSPKDRRHGLRSVLGSAWRLVRSSICNCPHLSVLQKMQLAAWSTAVAILPKRTARPLVSFAFDLAPSADIAGLLRRS